MQFSVHGGNLASAGSSNYGNSISRGLGFRGNSPHQLIRNAFLWCCFGSIHLWRWSGGSFLRSDEASMMWVHSLVTNEVFIEGKLVPSSSTGRDCFISSDKCTSDKESGIRRRSV